MTKQNKWKKFVGEKPLILALASLLLVVALSFLIIQPQLSGRAAYQTQAVELAVGEVGLDPAVGLVKTAETFESTLKANLGASQATAIEAKILYPAEKVELVEVRSIQDTGIISGSAKWAELFKDIDISTSGEVHLRHAIIPEVTGGNPITGVVDLFVIEFRAKEIDEASETQIILEESRILYGDLNLVNSFKSADYSITVGEVCDNGIDDDGNGPIDCNDPACQGVGSCIITQFECPTTCGYSAECCQAVAGCDLYQGQCLGVATSCANMQATSRDELACAEPCIFIEDAVTSARNVCLTPTELDCQNEVDDDGDGRLDCSDRDCFANSLCAQSDDDEDGITNLNDNCPYTVTDTQNDNDQDGLGDGCDLDDDNDGIADSVDNCPLTANSGQLDSDGDGLGDSCDEDNTNGPGGDIDADGVLNSEDNCPNDANPGQEDSDNDGTPDACGDDDDDNDLIMDNADNCPMVANSGIDFSKNVAVNTFNSDGAINTGDILSTLSTGSFEINEVGNSIRFKYRTLADTYSIRFIVEDHNYPQLNLEFNNIRYSKSHGSICVSATECGLAPSEEWFEYEFKIQEKLGDSSYWIKQIIRVESLTNIEIDDLIVFTPSQEISQKDTDGDGLGDACDANLGCSEDRNCPFKQTCQEGECKLAPAEILCADRVDNDHDGWWDCADSDCSDSSQCAVGSFCSIDATNDVYSCERRVNAVAGGTDYDSLTDGYSCEGVYSGVPLMKSISGFSYLESNAGTLEIKDDWPQICRGATTLGARRNCLLNHGSLFNLHESTCYLDSEVSCSNGIDENANGLYDCAEPSCVGELNGNGATCCQIESDCGAVQECSNNICIAKVEILCTDNLDNDGDGLSDCQDSDCARDLSCSDICLAKDSEYDGNVCVKRIKELFPSMDYSNKFDNDCVEVYQGVPIVQYGGFMVPHFYTPEGSNVQVIEYGGVLTADDPLACPSSVVNDLSKLRTCIDIQPTHFEPFTQKSCLPDEICGDKRDNDGNGLFDCADAVCQIGAPNHANERCCSTRDVCTDLTGASVESVACQSNKCVELTCNDGLDNDGDGKIDCADSDCHGIAGATGAICCGTDNQCQSGERCNLGEFTCDAWAEICTDDKDNDNDGLIDCRDPNCLGETDGDGNICGTEICTNNFDDDNDGLIDCADSDCVREFNGEGKMCCQSAGNCAGGGADCSINNVCIEKWCSIESDSHVLGNTDNAAIDNDNDGLVNCEDNDCRAICGNYISGDVNGDETINVLDIIPIIDHVIGRSLLAILDQGIADTNCDDTVNALDILKIIEVIVDNDKTQITCSG